MSMFGAFFPTPPPPVFQSFPITSTWSSDVSEARDAGSAGAEALSQHLSGSRAAAALQNTSRAKTPSRFNSHSPVLMTRVCFLPGSRSFLSGNWRRRKRAPHLTAKRSPPSSREWEPRSAWAVVLRLSSRCSDADSPAGGTYYYTTVTKSIL